MYLTNSKIQPRILKYKATYISGYNLHRFLRRTGYRMNSEYIVSAIKLDIERHKSLIKKFESELELLPEGGLCRKVVNGKAYLYHYKESDTDPGTFVQRFIAEDETDLKQGIKRKHFIKKSIPLLYKNIKVLDRFLKDYRPYNPSDIVSSLPKAYEDFDYASKYDGALGVDFRTWKQEEYKKNEFYPEGLIYGTAGGLKVRSKSEAIIAGLLEINDIPFRYEAELKLGERTYYPDFTILKPKDNGIVYWEHFGMVDDEGYSFSMEQKLSNYRRHDIMPWNKLIATYESENQPIDAQIIHNIIKAFIL